LVTGLFGDHRKSCGQCIDIAENACRGEGFGERNRGGLDLARVTGPTRQP
jgi:hypothetical protein